MKKRLGRDHLRGGARHLQNWSLLTNQTGRNLMQIQQRTWPILKILMSVLVIAAGIAEWVQAEEQLSSLKVHHGVIIAGLVSLIDGAEKFSTLSSGLKRP
jgi:hypothetical protein